jgi:hypothetical protein
MLNIRASKATKESASFNELKRKGSENNIAWLKRAMGSDKKNPSLVLIGGRNRCAFRVRVAQSHARDDLTPSHWSHVLILPELSASTSRAWEVSLERSDGEFPPDNNAVQFSAFGDYAKADWYPNIAWIRLDFEAAAVRKVVETFKRQRGVLDVVELVVHWLGFVWGVGRTGNPLFDGMGLPSAVLAEQVLGTLGMDLTPVLASRSSCPEAIWQAAKWWHTYYAYEKRPPVFGSWCVDHRL